MTQRRTSLASSSNEQRNAVVAYEQRRNAIKAQLALLAAKLDRHARQQAKSPNDWGYTGDLASVERDLRNINAGLYPEDEQ